MEEKFKVETPLFTGPMDLLIFLVQKQEVDLYDISITRLIRDYFEYLAQLKQMDVDVAAEFVSMSAYLLLLKSKAMLPVGAVGDEEEFEPENPQWELIKQLIEYKKFKDASKFLEEREAMFHGMYPSIPHHEVQEGEEPSLPKDLDTFALASAFQEVLLRLEEKNAEGVIKDEVYTVAEKIQELRQRLKLGEAVRLDSLLNEVGVKAELIALFLAMLEMAKVNLLGIRQLGEDRFGSIEITLLSTEGGDHFELTHD